MKRVKIAFLLLRAREAQWPEALDWLAVAPLARTQSERAAKDCVGNRFGSQVVWNRSNRCAGERGRGAGRQPQVAEDLDDHRRIFDGGDDLQSAAAVGAVFDVDVKDPFEQPGPTHARRRALPVSVLA